MSRTAGVLLLFSLSGCTYASTTMLSPDTAVISASDSEGSANAVRHKALVTAAREAKERGYEFFAIVAVNDGRTSKIENLRGAILEHTTNAPAAGSWSVTYSGAEADLTVHFLHARELPANRNGIYEASALLAH
jgi:hypothetical protein